MREYTNEEEKRIHDGVMEDLSKDQRTLKGKWRNFKQGLAIRLHDLTATLRRHANRRT